MICDYCAGEATNVIRWEPRTRRDPDRSYGDPMDVSVCDEHLDIYRRALLNDGARVKVMEVAA